MLCDAVDVNVLLMTETRDEKLATTFSHLNNWFQATNSSKSVSKLAKESTCYQIHFNLNI